ncbi:MAG: two-component system, OmpR family, sensor kinase [Solirubrobacteraceae bacterium]|nr:two-component system, OmpR family, sensor kinase [Solirubrobacteraceae bacterium]
MRSIANRLALLFGAITLGVIGVVYVYVVPQLESSLREQRLRTLTATAKAYSGGIRSDVQNSVDVRRLNTDVRRAADAANARVTLLLVNRTSSGLQVVPQSDSTTEVEIRDLQFAVAIDAAASGKVAVGSEAGDAGRVAEAALPIRYRRSVGAVIVFSAPLTDVEDNVALIRRRILTAGGLALLGALLAGYWVAQALSRRVKRLEVAAGRVASGDFAARFPVDSADELGQLARALDRMQNQLAELDSARKRFIATASHELRTPIFSLGGFLELLADEELDEDTRRSFVHEIRGQVDRLGKLATDLLDLSRLEAGSLELRMEPTDVATICRMVAGEFAPAVAQSESDLDLDMPADPLEATCDPERVAQIMRILIDNALRHTPDRTPVVVSAAADGAMVRLAVIDRGPGLRRGEVERIFEPFYTSDDARGSGLGLAIARELAERMEGRLDAHSVPGRTTFSLRLPVEPVPSPREASAWS